MKTTVKILLDRDLEPYRGGELVTGSVIVTNGTLIIQQLSQDLMITFSGKAWTKWDESDTGGISRVCTGDAQQSLTETYFNENLSLVRPGSSTSTLWIVPGITVFPFQFELPMGLPSSFDSKYGGVRYTASVLLSSKNAKKWEKEIHVQGSYNLDLDLGCRQPGVLVRKVRPWWNRSYVVEAFLSIEKRGFFPGDELPFLLEVNNFSYFQLQKIRVNLIMETTYISKSTTLAKTLKCQKLRAPQLSRGESLRYAQSFILPSDLPLTNLGACRIVKPRYFLQLKIKARLFWGAYSYTVVKELLPISIGTPGGTNHPRPPPARPTPGLSYSDSSSNSDIVPNFDDYENLELSQLIQRGPYQNYLCY